MYTVRVSNARNAGLANFLGIQMYSLPCFKAGSFFRAFFENAISTIKIIIVSEPTNDVTEGGKLRQSA